MRVLVCVVLLMGLAAAEPPSYRPFRAGFEIGIGDFNGNQEGSEMKELRPYPAAGYKPFREFKIPSHFEEVKRPSLRQEVPKREQNKFRMTKRPHLNYGVPEKETERKQSFEKKVHESKKNDYFSSNEASMHHYYYPPTEYGPSRKEEGEEQKSERLEENSNSKSSEENSEESEGNSKESNNKVEESEETGGEESKENSKESSEESKESENTKKETEVKENKNAEKGESEENTEDNMSSEKSSEKKEEQSDRNREQSEGKEPKPENKFRNRKEKHEKHEERKHNRKEEKSKEENKETFESFNGNTEVEIKQHLEDGIEDDVDFKPSGPFYIVVKSSPDLNGAPYPKQAQTIPYGAAPFQNPAQFPSVPFQRQIDLSNVGYSSYYQQRAIDSAPFSYYFQPKLQQNPYFLPYGGNQWGNQW